MSSIYPDKGKLVVAFTGPDGKRVLLHTGLRASRTGWRSPLLKELEQLIELRRWGDISKRFRCKALRSFVSEHVPTLEAFSRARLEELQAMKRAEGTLSHYRSLFRSRLWPSPISRRPLNTISDRDVILWMGEMESQGVGTDRIAKARRALFSIFQTAVRRRLVEENPVRFTDPPKRDDDIEVNPFSADDARAVINVAEGRDKSLLTVLIGTGLRPGEALGLRREHLDFDEGKIRVRKTVGQHGASRRGEGKPKTKRSRRDVDMPAPVRHALEQQLARVQLTSEFVFPNEKGGAMDLRNFGQRNWRRILKKAGAEARNIYQCRHTFARLMLENNVSIQYVADQLGHRDLQMVIRHYGRWMPGKPAGPDRDLMKDLLYPISAPTARI
jgi:integrase